MAVFNQAARWYRVELAPIGGRPSRKKMFIDDMRHLGFEVGYEPPSCRRQR